MTANGSRADVDAVIGKLEAMAIPENRAGMARYGINVERALGVSLPEMRVLARQHRRDHGLALGLWDSGIHEARVLASLVEDPHAVTRNQMNAWARDFDSWDICDQCCNNLFRRTQFAHDKALQWSHRKAEFVRRAGFALMACLSVHDKAAGDERFLSYLEVVEKTAGDERNFVKKAVNWALRQIGKRNEALHRHAVKTAGRIMKQDSKSARWIASDALRELQSPAVLKRLKG